VECDRRRAGSANATFGWATSYHSRLSARALAIAQVALGTSFPLVGVVKAAFARASPRRCSRSRFTLVQVAVLAWAVNAMARKFQALPDRLAALQGGRVQHDARLARGILYLVPLLAFFWMFAARTRCSCACLGSRPDAFARRSKRSAMRSRRSASRSRCGDHGHDRDRADGVRAGDVRLGT
jgi:hypothetical protein